MITKEQAIDQGIRTFHYTGKFPCSFEVGKRGGERIYITEARRNGAAKTWKTRPEDFEVPVKLGLYEYAYLTNSNANDFHVEGDCPACQARDEHHRKLREEQDKLFAENNH